MKLVSIRATQSAVTATLRAIALAVFGTSLVACTPKTADAPPAIRSVRVAAARVAPLDEQLRAVGLLGPKDEMRLAFKVSGVLDSIRVEEGQAVKGGDVLAVLKQTEIDSSVDQAHEATVKAQRDLVRGRALLKDDVATDEQVQDLTTSFKVASAAERSAHFNAAYTRIVAAGDGVVLRKLVEQHELVQAGQTVLVLGGDARGWVVRFGLADRDVVRVRLGDTAQVTFDAWPGVQFSGRVSNKASAADPATGTFTVEVQVASESARFVQGLVAKVTLNPQGAIAGQLVPVQALLEANDKEAGVFVLDPPQLHNSAPHQDAAQHTVHRITVQIGRLHNGEVEVLGGLAADALVVVDGAAFLNNGDIVRVAADSAPVAGDVPVAGDGAPVKANVPANGDNAPAMSP